MKRLLHIAMCMIAAFLMVPVEGDCAEIMETEPEAEIMIECVRPESTEEAYEPEARIVKSDAAETSLQIFKQTITPRPVAPDLRIIYCVFRE